MVRLLDVLFQHLRVLAACTLAVTLLAATGAFWLGGSRVITARVRVEPASFVSDALPDLFPVSESPARAVADLIDQLVQTDAFSRRVATGHGVRGDGLADDLRSHLRVRADSPSILVLDYVTGQPDGGVATLAAVLVALAQAVQSVEVERASAVLRASSGALGKAHEDQQRSIDEAKRYAYSSDQAGEALSTDPVYRGLLAAVQAATDHYRAVSALLDQASVASQAATHARTEAFAVVDLPRAQPAARATAAARYGLLAVMGTSALGILAVYLIAVLDPRLRSAGDLRRHLSTCLLVSAPPTDRNSPAGAAVRRPPWAVAMAEVLASRPDRGGVVAVVGHGRDEGRSTVAAGLAAALAEHAGGRVLLIDLDLESSVQAARWEMPASPGVVDCLESPGRLAEVARSVRGRLWLLPAGVGGRPASAGLLHDVADGGLLAACRSAFTWTVVDLPPLVEAPDVVSLAALVDHRVMVGRYRRTRVDAVARSAALLCGPVLGCVMTDHRPPIPAWAMRLLGVR
ncbi:MAG: polysaccharide biosynthesis transport protein [Chloroflexota bacterium]|nr:polysaccharide biosynthesis transport protein [Chloroflexota bacterium]